MGVFYSPNRLSSPSVVTFGNFDGVHLGHLSLLGVLREIGEPFSLHKVVVTFDPHPLCFLEGRTDFLIADRSAKIDLLLPHSDYLYLIKFDRGLRNLSPREFLSFLSSFLNIKYLVSGENCRFGKLGVGSIEDIEKYQDDFHYKAFSISSSVGDGERYSSTLVRSNIKNGNMRKVRQLLGRYHSIIGTVRKEKGFATKIGVPTMNIAIPEEIIKPKLGVYAVDVLVKGIIYQGVANIGRRPTVSSSAEIVLEVHLFNFSGEMSGETIRVYLKIFLREEAYFRSIDDLKTQILLDIQDALSKS